MFIATLFILDKKWKQPTDEWINKNGISIQWTIIKP